VVAPKCLRQLESSDMPKTMDCISFEYYERRTPKIRNTFGDTSKILFLHILFVHKKYGGHT
jgi:hypothetical protein